MFSLKVIADHAPKTTKTTAAMTTVAQKTPIPAITRSWCFRATGGGTSGIRIFLDFDRKVTGTSVKHLRWKSQGVDAIEALERLLEKTGIRDAISYRGETACFLKYLLEESGLPATV